MTTVWIVSYNDRDGGDYVVCATREIAVAWAEKHRLNAAKFDLPPAPDETAFYIKSWLIEPWTVLEA